MGKNVSLEIGIILFSLFLLCIVIVHISSSLKKYEENLKRVLKDHNEEDKKILCLPSEKCIGIGIIWKKTSSISNVLNIGVSLCMTALLLILGITSMYDTSINFGGIISSCISTIILCSILIFCIGKNDILTRYQSDLEKYVSGKTYDEVLNTSGIRHMTFFLVSTSVLLSTVIMVLDLSYFMQLIIFIVWGMCVFIEITTHIISKS